MAKSRSDRDVGIRAVCIPCAVAPAHDGLDLFRHTEGSWLVISAFEEDTNLNVYLDAAGARALFNWLGVELHKGGLR